MHAEEAVVVDPEDDDAGRVEADDDDDESIDSVENEGVTGTGDTPTVDLVPLFVNIVVLESLDTGEVVRVWAGGGAP